MSKILTDKPTCFGYLKTLLYSKSSSLVRFAENCNTVLRTFIKLSTTDQHVATAAPLDSAHPEKQTSGISAFTNNHLFSQRTLARFSDEVT